MTGTEIRRGPMAADNFTQVSNRVFRNPSLSAKAMGVFGHLSTHSNGFHTSVKHISQYMRDGEDAIRAALKELEREGYIFRAQERTPDGTLGKAVFYFTDSPDLCDLEAWAREGEGRLSTGRRGAPEKNHQNPRSTPERENPDPVGAHPPSDGVTREDSESSQVGTESGFAGSGVTREDSESSQVGTESGFTVSGKSGPKNTSSYKNTREKNTKDNPPPSGSTPKEPSSSEPTASDSDGCEGFSVEDVREALKAGGQLTDEEAAVVARRACEVADWGIPADDIRALLGRVRKDRPVEEFLAWTASPSTVREHGAGERDAPGQREDVESVCKHLADTVEELGFTRPKVTQAWRKSARLLLDKDYALQWKVDEAAVIRVIDWIAESDFWGRRGNIRSMPTLRRQFEKLAAQKRQEHSQRSAGSGGGGSPRRPYRNAEAHPEGRSTAQKLIDADPDNPDPFPQPWTPSTPNNPPEEPSAGQTDSDAGDSGVSGSKSDAAQDWTPRPPQRRQLTPEELAELDPFPQPVKLGL